MQNSPLTVLAGEALEPRRFVRFNGTAWVMADANTSPDGVHPNRESPSSNGTPNAGYGPAYLLNHSGTVEVEAGGSITAGNPVYLDADGKIISSGLFPVGRALQAGSSGSTVEIIPFANQGGGARAVLANTVADSGTTVTNTTTETSFGSTATIPANTLKAGDRIRIRSHGITPSTNGTDTLTVKLKIGSSIVFATAAIDVANNDTWVIDAEVTVRTTGASGTIIASGMGVLGVPTTATARGSGLASTTLDTTAAATIDATATWSAASASNQATQRSFTVEVIRGAA